MILTFLLSGISLPQATEKAPMMDRRTIKREASYHSLKQPYGSQILTTKDLFMLAEEK